ncbi:MAG: 4Fe-4S dicluster domain-containing protein [Athalassotoga sp.]|uniref:4Fe-4S dicluster domain-containing protein n=1 Tax=Athalassotoga sp. TaxID=2022597 RepID=UPI003D05FF08
MAEDMFSKWHGLDRKKINWGPVIDPNKCTGCGLCVVTCGEKRNVFGYDPVNKKAVVLFQERCMVGCNNCQVGCLWNAITFETDEEYIRNLAKTIPPEQIQKELKAKLEANPDLVIE